MGEIQTFRSNSKRGGGEYANCKEFASLFIIQTRRGFNLGISAKLLLNFFLLASGKSGWWGFFFFKELRGGVKKVVLLGGGGR